MRAIKRTISAMTNDTDGIAASQTPSGAGSLTLNGALVSSGVATAAMAQRVAITSSGNDSGVTFSVTGKDADGRDVSETGITGPNATTVYSTNYYKDVSDVTISAAGTGNITVGWANNGGYSQSIPMDTYQNPFNVSLLVDVTGTISYTVQYTLDTMFDADVTPTWYSHPSLVTLGTDASGNFAFPVTGIRFNSISGTGSAVFTVAQAGMPGRG